MSGAVTDTAVDALCGDLSSIRAPRGTVLNALSWSTEAPLRMLLNNLDSEVADLSHVSRDRSISGGAITAALFLREFAGARRWAHLDIAGPARAERPEHEVTKGATGFGARLLLRWLETLH